MEKKNITTIVFDLDGTLLDTLEDLVLSVNFALRKNNYPQCSKSEIRKFLGNGIRFLMKNAVPLGLSEKAFEKVFGDFRTYYLEHCLDKTCPYEGIMDLLAELKSEGYKLAIVSNKLQPAVTELNDRFFSKYVAVAIGESEMVRRKPAPDSVFTALKRLGCRPENAIYVGDSEVDMETAANAGLPCISVLWGFRDRSFLEERKAKYLIDFPKEILTVIKNR